VSRGIGRLQEDILMIVESNAAGGADLPAGEIAALTSREIRQRLPYNRSSPRAVWRSLVNLEEGGLLVSLAGGRGSLGVFTPLLWTTPTELARAGYANQPVAASIIR
jgi:hypothetical protein